LHVNDRLISLFFLDSNRGWALSDSGTILQTTNGGSNWSEKTI